MIAIGALLVVVVCVLLVFLGLLFGGPDDSDRVPAVARWLGVATIVITGAVAAYATLSTLVSDRLTLSVPIAQLPLRPPDGVTFAIPPTATIVSGGFDRVTVVADGLGAATRGLLVVSIVLGAATVIGATLVVTRLARSLREGDPFRRGGRALRATALIVLIGGTLASVTGDLAHSIASRDLFEVRGWTYNGESPLLSDDAASELTALGWPDPVPIGVTLPFWPLAAGIVLLLLAAAFHHGAGLRRETEGLI